MPDNIQFESGVELKTAPDVKEPKLYKVIIHNDNYTTMDFVVEVIMYVFHKPAAEATRLMLEVHKQGQAVAGVYSYDIAVTKTEEVRILAHEKQFPLLCTCEEA